MQESEHHGDRWFKEAAEQAKTLETIEQLIEQLTAATKAAGIPLGATDHFPQGALTPDDEGELRLAVTAPGGKVILAFGKPIEPPGQGHPRVSPDGQQRHVAIGHVAARIPEQGGCGRPRSRR